MGLFLYLCTITNTKYQNSMKKAILSALSFMLMLTSASAQNLNMTIKVEPADTVNLDLYLQSGKPFDSEPVQMQRDAKGNYSVSVPQDGKLFYDLTCMKNGGQYSIPLFLEGDQASFALTMKNDIPDALTPVGKQKKAKAGEANNVTNAQAIMDFFRVDCEVTRTFWMEMNLQTPETSIMAIRRMLDSAAEVMKRTDVSDNVKQYVGIWVYLDAYNIIDSYNRTHEGHIDGAEILKLTPPEVLDNPLSLYHYYSTMAAYINVPKKELPTRIEYVRNHYKTPEVREAVEKFVLDYYLRYYRFEIGAEKGLKELTEAKQRFDIPDTYLEQFREKMSSISGSPFPEGVILEDENGNKIDFAQFRGKYVYIDLWASWCGPCVKEAPYLKQLEAELKNDKVVFVSISCDTKRDAWLKKKADLGLHGNQFINIDNSLCNKLNVDGIPRFLIYNPEGKMFSYNAPRPSSGEEIRTLLESLK